MRVSRSLAGLVATCLAGAGITAVLPATEAQAVQNNSVPGAAAPAWQTNGTVRALAYANGIVYLGGDFTAVRPPGAAAGTQEVTRNHFAAFNASTGALITGINHNVSANVYGLSVSSDGATLYMGGDFTTVDGATRNRAAAFSLAGSTIPLTSWNPNVSARVNSIAATPSTVYLAGSFTKVNGLTATRLAAVNAANISLKPGFSASADATVYQLALSKPLDKLYLAGGFTSINGDTTQHSAAVLDPATGSAMAFPAASVIPPKTAGCISEMKTVKTDGDTVYYGAEGTGGGCFDGTFAANIAGGTLKWQSQCLGATQGLAVANGLVYTGSHSHDCTGDQSFDPDAFPEIGWAKGLGRHLLARNASDGKVSSWYPNTNGGPGGTGLGPRVLETDGSQVFVGGEFTFVNSQAQQGFTRFSPATGDTSAPAKPAAPVAVARAGGAVSVFVQAPLDIDDTDVVIRLYRDGGSTPIASAPAHSLFWRVPVASFEDNGLAIGSTHTYTADAIEANGTNVSFRSGASSAITVTSALTGYAQAVAADAPNLFWRLGDKAAPLAGDLSGSLTAGVFSGGVTFGAAGQAPDTDKAILTDGSTGYVSSASARPTPGSFSVETWVKTSTTQGGKIIGFGNRQGGLDFNGNPALSNNYDKQIYMTNDGRIVFGVYNNGTQTLASSTPYNDGQWHHLVGTQGATGMTLYIDGVRIGRNGVVNSQPYTGYWRVGGDNLNGWPSQPTSNFFSGAIDDVAVFPAALTKDQVVAHYVASGRTPPPVTGPSDLYGKSVIANDPVSFWRLDETSGSTAVDSSDNGTLAQYVGGVTPGAAGALGGQGTSATFDGSTGNVVSASQINGPGRFALELWFSTTTTAGGKLIGFGSSQTGNSGSYDKQVYMTADGRLIFGVYNGSFDLVTSAPGTNDGQWHHVVAQQSPAGMAMYLDDRLVGTNTRTTNQGYTGYWRVGGDNLGSWPSQPPSSYFAGAIDEVAIYADALTAEQVDAHYTSSGRQGPDTVAPVTAITSPSEGASVLAGDVAVTATASDAGGVASVDLLVDGNSVASRTSAPYTFTWNASAGQHVLTSVARDPSGNTTTSAPVNVLVTVPDTTAPTASITSPQQGDSVYGDTAVTATASDNVAVASVALKVDGSTVATDTSAPYEFVWNATSPGSHSLVAVAQDTSGNTGSSTAVGVTVVLPPDTTAPSAPTNLAGTASTDHVDLTWTAASDDRGVTGYRIVRDGAILPDDVTATSFTDTAVATSTTYQYAVRAVDAAGNIGPASNTVSVRTPDLTSPQTAISAPVSGDTVYGSTTVTATASDDTAVASVALKVDGTTIATDTTAPYSFTWNAVDAGSHTLTTVATDTAGNLGSSDPVTVTVAVPADTTAPTAPGPLTATETARDHVTLSWGAATDNVGVTGYQVLRNGSVISGSLTATTYTDSTVTASTSYTYVVRAVDAAGNVSPNSNSVVVTTPAATAVIFSDAWTGANGTPWSSSWTTSVSSGSVTTQSGAGVLAVNDVAGAYARAQLSGAAARANTDSLFSYTWSATNANAYLDVYVRGSGGWQNAYRPRNGYGIELSSASGTVTVFKNVNGTNTSLRSVASGQKVTTAKQWLRIRVNGTSFQWRIWSDGTTEPTTWTSTDTDSSVSAAGQLFVAVNRASSNVGAKSVAIDDLVVTDLTP